MAGRLSLNQGTDPLTYFRPWGTEDPGDYWNAPNCFFVAYGQACAARTDFAVASDGWAAKDYNIMSGAMPGLTENLGMSYWDLYEFSYDYLFRSGKPYFYYSRDAQHANEYNRVLSANQLFEVFKLVAEKDFTTH